MHRIILLLVVIAIIYYLLYRFKRLQAEKQSQLIKLLSIAGLALLVVMLALTGKLSWLLAAIAAVVPLVPRLLRFALGAWPALRPLFLRYRQNKQSSMQTQIIKLQIDMLTGELKGEVLAGEFKGEKLQAMQLEQLLILLQRCSHQDQASAALLESYLNRVYPEWTKQPGHSSGHAVNSDMSEQQAREILGVKLSASKKDITRAHKQLMQKMHPDRGGSDFLAQQINKARDVLFKCGAS